MRLELFDEDGKKKRLNLSAENFALQIPESSSPVFLQATFDEASPIKIVMNSANGAPKEVPVRGLRLNSGIRKFIKPFSYRRPAKTIQVGQHWRTQPLYFRSRNQHLQP